VTRSRPLLDPRIRRSWLVQQTPAPLLESPLEVLLTVWGILSGLAALVLTDVPSSLLQVLPRWAAVVWSINLLVGGVLIGVGLWRRWYATAVPRGLQLIASSCACYSVAIMAINGLNGLPAGGLLLAVAMLSGLRAVKLQWLADAAREIERATR